MTGVPPARRRPARLARAAAGVVPVLPEVRIARPDRPLTARWQHVPVTPAGETMLGVSFRPLQAAEFGLDPVAALDELLTYPVAVIRLAAYWNRLETSPGQFDTGPLDAQMAAASLAGKKIILCLGAVKAFGYPEFFVPRHYLPVPLPERSLISPDSHASLADAATRFLTMIVQRYRDWPSVIAWQVEHEAVDPLGMEHSWRLSARFAGLEVAAVRAADPSRPVVLSGFLPTSLPVRLQQRWRTRDQGDSLAIARQLADVVGVDFYPRHGLARLGSRTAYLAGSGGFWTRRANRRFCAAAGGAPGTRLMIAEGQAEPWETVTRPPSVPGSAMYSCQPEHVIENYNEAMQMCGGAPWAYLFWGAEYWLARQQSGDVSYLSAFRRVLAGA